MKQYHDLLKDVLENGFDAQDRTGTGTRSVFGRQCRYDLSKGFPLLTTKRVYWKGVVIELLWFLMGSTNTKYLEDNNVSIWREWADENGDLGPVYGKQWRSWETNIEQGLPMGKSKFETIDQISNLIHEIKNNPNSRRLIVSSWNVADISKMALPPCHAFFQFEVKNRKLSCHLFQRSVDCALGLPFNIASYALLTHIIANICDLEVGEFVHTMSNTHIYLNHIDGVREQLKRTPKTLPTLKIKRKFKSIDDCLDFSDFELEGYNPDPLIKFDVAV